MNEQFIINKVLRFTGMTMDELIVKTRKRECVEVRQLIFSYLKRYTMLSLQSIGDYFNKDHATVLYGIRRIEELMQVDKQFRNKYHELEVEIINEYNRIEGLKADEKKYSVSDQNNRIFSDILGMTNPPIEIVSSVFLGC